MGTEVTRDLIIPGRVQRVELCKGRCSTVVWNVHNFRLAPPVPPPPEELAAVAMQMGRDIAKATAYPENFNFNVLIAGDFKFSARSMPSLVPESAGRGFVSDVSLTIVNEGQKALEAPLGRMAELASVNHSHYDARLNRFIAIDRVFTAAPPWALVNMAIRCEVLHDPPELRAAGISDHSPLAVEFSPRPSLPAGARPIPKVVFLHPRFKQAHDKMAAEMLREDMPVWERVRIHKAIILGAACRARDSMLCDPKVASDQQRHLVLLNSIARATVKRDQVTLQRLYHVAPAAREMLCFVGAVCKLRDSVLFGDWLAEARRAVGEASNNKHIPG